MWRLLGLVSLQTIFLSGVQVLLKLALSKLGKFEWTKAYLISVLTNWWLLACGICFGIAALLWLYILKRYPLNQAYPLESLSYVFGMIAALLIFGEAIPFYRWIGLVLVILGCMLIIR